MIFKIVKWAYDRGIEHERQRIKALIAEFGREVNTELRHAPLSKDKSEYAQEKHDLDVKMHANAIVRKLLWAEDHTYGPRFYSPIEGETPKDAKL